MKKIISLLLITLLVISFASVSYASDPVGGGVKVTFTKNGDIIKANVVLYGSTTADLSLKQYVMRLQYDYNDVNFCKVDGTPGTVAVLSYPDTATLNTYFTDFNSEIDTTKGGAGVAGTSKTAITPILSYGGATTANNFVKFTLKKDTGGTARIVAPQNGTSQQFALYFKLKAGRSLSASTFTWNTTTTDTTFTNGDGTTFYYGSGTYSAPQRFAMELPASGFNVDYVENGGTAVTDLTTVTALPATLAVTTREGYTFDGWFYANNTLAKANDVISANTTLTAKWTVIPVVNIPLVSGDVIKQAGQNAVPVKVKDGSGQIVDGTVDNAVVVTVPGKVPATIDSQAAVEAHEFGIEFGGVKFPAGFNASTFASLSSNGGKYIIKLVDTSGKLTGKTFKAYNYFDTQKSTDYISITID